ncbi:MAG: hypothetical protein A2087_04205 [Spirochaetes bacterium GWD1_61_31]|nr:MAG: hypothetical protein A2Y37_10770 [Spirochaetes bacterium GWB1_60_80]OHD34097.1 MAG: hypothetical protein A2004_05145 [Spirochaetes bacterium GWC1_61_12]OHD35413.1 MAG: hypothetical protein A2087_04205 [Spirochaetes bacterium GWD1_61_31]OHD44921.1 MAG: hypothetical protein A2Y35_12810 [Spirochaetes bacterium GWE1_60_18]OHD60032.1 MAG: hypothetical protein A2Y32_10920 [Spirochaetes bacterium GWF1_60_12]
MPDDAGRPVADFARHLAVRLAEIEGENSPLAADYRLAAQAYLKLSHQFDKVLSISDRYQDMFRQLEQRLQSHRPAGNPERRIDAGLAEPELPFTSLLEHPEPMVRQLTLRYQKLSRQLSKIMAISDAYQDELKSSGLRMELMAKTDELTGLSNRRDMMERLELEYARSLRNHQPMAVIMFDIDDFKAINDAWGHDTGDLALKAIAEALRGRLRRSDSCARWGGEEFLVLCTDSTNQQAEVVAEKCRQAIEELSLGARTKGLRSELATTTRPVTEFRCSVSGGVASGRGGEETWERLVYRADVALYQAKAAGKNRVVLADDNPEIGRSGDGPTDEPQTGADNGSTPT